VLTPIVERPTNTTLQLLTQELYANARAIHSTRGGGANGHLALIMPDATYLARTGLAFNPPAHPGENPIHPPGATQAQINEINRLYYSALAEHSRFLTVAEELKKQLFAAVDKLYFRILADPLMGFADVSCQTLLAHLHATYGVIEREEIDANRDRLSADWNPDNPLEALWFRLAEAQRYAIAAGEPLTDSACIRLTLRVLEKTGVFLSACERWRERDAADWTMANFQDHFEKANKERLRKLTAQAAGFHGAHATTLETPAAPTIERANAVTDQPSPTPPRTPARNARTTDGTTIYYCWTHGLHFNSRHTSATCEHKADGHNDAATLTNMLGGNNRFQRPRERRPPNSPRQHSGRG
jgi:hypothetical protein